MRHIFAQYEMCMYSILKCLEICPCRQSFITYWSWKREADAAFVNTKGKGVSGSVRGRKGDVATGRLHPGGLCVFFNNETWNSLSLVASAMKRKRRCHHIWIVARRLGLLNRHHLLHGAALPHVGDETSVAMVSPRRMPTKSIRSLWHNWIASHRTWAVMMVVLLCLFSVAQERERERGSCLYVIPCRY